MFRKLILAPLLLLACNGTESQDQRTQAQKTADTYLASKSLLDRRMPVTVEDAGEHWLVTYHIPEGAIGGGHRVWIDKQTMQVVTSVGSQ